MAFTLSALLKRLKGETDAVPEDDGVRRPSSVICWLNTECPTYGFMPCSRSRGHEGRHKCGCPRNEHSV